MGHSGLGDERVVTAEIALLNKFAIALAADSARTVTYWDKNESKTRYFKGANKVFNYRNVTRLV
jgi:hypothetical protein